MINENKDQSHIFSYYKYTAAPVQVAMDITSKCNLRCVHCFNDSGDSAPLSDLSPVQKIDLAKQVADLHPINTCICGGETTCSEVLFEVIDALNPGVGSRKVSMVSNGYLMTPKLAEKIKDHGVSMVQISIDGINAWQHDSFRGVDGSFDRAVNAVKYLVDTGMEVNTSLVPNKLNYRDIREYIKMCADLKVAMTRMMPFLPSGRGISVGSRLMLDEEQYFAFQRMVAGAAAEFAGKTTVQWGDPIDHMRRMPFNGENGLHSYVMEIKTDGALTFCTYLPVTVGNCTRHSLKEYWDRGYKTIWADPEYTQYTEKIRNIYDLEDFEPQPYSGEIIELDLIRD